jgi:cytochrome c oxidase accessory protein FixG
MAALQSAIETPARRKDAFPRDAAPGIAREDAEAVNARQTRPLYASREPIYPKLASGTFRRAKWAVMAVTLGIYYLLPWLRWHRGPNLPDQAFLLDFAHQRLFLFGIEIWAQEMYFVTGLLILGALALFLVTALAGRVWCGYACPQTVWTDLMIAVERLWQGDRNARMRLAKAPWTFDKLWKLTGTHVSWLLISVATGGAFVFYFRDAPTLAYELVTFDAPAIAYVFLGVFTATTYVLGGLAREQVCIYMCPWPRIQGAMFDADSLLITYRGWRGEQRGPHKKGQSWEGRGDCIDCKQCVAVCPVGIDIRDGAQLECIQCALCIDACDDIMFKVGRPPKLIAYDTFRNLDAASHGERAPIRLIRPRTILYGSLLALVAAVMLFGLTNRSVLDVNVLRDRNPLYVQLADGGLRNGYTVKLLNKAYDTRNYALSVEGLPDARLTIVGVEGEGAGSLAVAPDDLRAIKAYVTLPGAVASRLPAAQNTLTFVVRDLGDGRETRHANTFRGPEK